MGRWSFRIVVLALFAAPVAAQQPLHVIEGVEDSNYPGFGHALASAGDVDGDGAFDLIIGNPYEGVPVTKGRVRIFSGATAALLVGPLDGGPAATGPGHYGWSVAGIGDVSGDGVPDIAIGVPDFGGPSVHGPGRVVVRSGASGALIRTTVGDEPGDELGQSVSSIGDLDLDGVPDYAGGASEDFEGHAGSGYVRVYSGASGATLGTIRAGATYSRFGQSVVGAGDVNFDGFPDVLIGASGGNFVQLRSGATGGLLWSRSGAPTFFPYFGWDVDRVGDVDADGIEEFLVGDPSANTASLLDSVTGVVELVIPFQADSFFGGAVAGLGDLDFDGRTDFAIGGKWYHAAGPGTGGVLFYSGATTLPQTRRIVGHASGDRVGFSLAALGDVDFDGIPDLAVGAPAENSNPGYVRIDSGTLVRSRFRKL